MSERFRPEVLGLDIFLAMRAKWAKHNSNPEGTTLTIRSVAPTEVGFRIEGNASPHAEVDPTPRIRLGDRPARVVHFDWPADSTEFVIEIAEPPVYGRETLGIWLGDPWGTFDLFDA